MADQLISGTTIIENKRTEKGEVWSCSAQAWQTARENDDVEKDDNRNQLVWSATAGSTIAAVDVQLPNGATITSCVVYGSDTGLTWTLYRDLITLAASADTLATANVGTEDTTISNAVIDNHNYCYWIVVSGLTSDSLYGARVKYEF